MPYFQRLDILFLVQKPPLVGRRPEPQRGHGAVQGGRVHSILLG